jgi:hypothetical protein
MTVITSCCPGLSGEAWAGPCRGQAHWPRLVAREGRFRGTRLALLDHLQAPRFVCENLICGVPNAMILPIPTSRVRPGWRRAPRSKPLAGLAGIIREGARSPAGHFVGTSLSWLVSRCLSWVSLGTRMISSAVALEWIFAKTDRNSHAVFWGAAPIHSPGQISAYQNLTYL